MKEFTLEGEVGWEVDAWAVKRILSEANGEDIKVNFSSPGGSVFEGFTVFNLFKNYSGNVDFHIIGLAASMGSYIPMSGRTITAEPNAILMTHNASVFTRGDHNNLRSAADIVEGLSNIKAKEFSKRTGKGIAEVKALMDDETWFIGGDKMVEAGFADSVVGEVDEDPNALQNSFALGKESFSAVIEKLKKEKPDDYKQAAAFMPKAKKDNVVKTKTAQSGNTKKGAFMPIKDLSQLKAEHPEIYKAAVSEGMEIGAKEAITKERDKVNALLILGKNSGDMETAIKAIKEGSEITQELTATFMMKAVNNRDIEANQTDTDEADPLKPKASPTGADGISKDVKDVLALVKEKVGFAEGAK